MPRAPQFDPRIPSVTAVLQHGDVPNFEGLDKDAAALVALGYKQEFKREFSLWTTFCVSFAVLGLLPSFATTLYYGMGYAGTGGMVWGWLIAWFFIQCVSLGMAELCSSMPTRCIPHEGYARWQYANLIHSGGLYYASAVLAPPGWGPMAAWFTGWSNWLGQFRHALGCSVNRTSGLYPTELSGLPPGMSAHDYPCLYLQYANPLDR